MQDVPLFRLDERAGVLPTALWALIHAVHQLGAAIRADLATGSGQCDTIIGQGVPARVVAAAAALLIWAEPLHAQALAIPDRLREGPLPAPARHQTPEPEATAVVEHIRQAWNHLADEVRQWLAEAAEEADRGDEAARLTMAGEARVVRADGVTFVYRLNGAAEPRK